MSRTVLVLLALAAFAGCATPAPAPDALEPGPDAPVDAFTMDGHPEFCASEDACDFWDDHYHQYVVYDLDTTTFDVVIVPPVGADPLALTKAVQDAVLAWGLGIQELSAPWLRDAFAMEVVVVGQDVPSIEAVQDPEIIVVSTGAQGILGIGLEPKQIGCQLIGEATIASYPVHAHRDVEVRASDCTNVGFTCFALNVGGMEPRALYDLVAHEVGHCLGAGHVGDALDFRARYAPVDDIMSYQNDPEQVHCVSTLDVRTLEGVYAHLVDGAEADPLPRGSYLEFDPRLYAQVECPNPDG